MADPTYKVLWKIETSKEGVKKEDVPDGHGACDSAVFISMMGQPLDGNTLSMMILSMNGEGGELTPDQMYIVWSMLTLDLADRLPHSPQRALVGGVADLIRQNACS